MLSCLTLLVEGSACRAASTAATSGCGSTTILRRRHLSISSTTSSAAPSSIMFPHFEVRQTRWNDNDGFGHINNSIYYNFMDDAVNMHLIDRGIGRDFPRFIAENGIQFFRPIAFPSQVRVGLRVVKLGSSAVTYDVGFYDDDDVDGSSRQKKEKQLLAARGKFVHVYVDETTGRPRTIPDQARLVLQQLVVEEEQT